MSKKRQSEWRRMKELKRQYGIDWPSMAILMGAVTLLCLQETHAIYTHLKSQGYSLTRMEYVFTIMSFGINMPYTSIAYLLLLGNVESVIRVYTKDIYKRRMQGIMGCLCASLVMVIIVTLLSYGMTLPIAESGSTWTEMSLLQQKQIEASVIPEVIFTAMQPLPSILLSVWILQMFWFGSALFLFALSQCGARYLGIMLYIVGIFWNSIWFGEEIAPWISVRCYSLQAMLRYAKPYAEYQAVMDGIKYLLLSVGLFTVVNVMIIFKSRYASRRIYP